MSKLRSSVLEEQRRKFLEEKYGKVDDNDILIVDWEHQRNVEGSEKLLHLLEFYHGDDPC